MNTPPPASRRSFPRSFFDSAPAWMAGGGILALISVVLYCLSVPEPADTLAEDPKNQHSADAPAVKTNAVRMPPFRGTVIYVSDGDSITVRFDNQPKKIRLYGIDCPELNQPGGKEAAAFTASLVLRKKVTVLPYGRDQYGRLLSVIQLRDGGTLNAELLRNGHAWVYSQHRDPPEPDPLVYLAAPLSKWTLLKEQAQKQKLGLWASSHPVPPWVWRRKHGR